MEKVVVGVGCRRQGEETCRGERKELIVVVSDMRVAGWWPC
jgi:hypothetical protein